MLKTPKTSFLALLLAAPLIAAPVLAEQHTAGDTETEAQSADTEMPAADAQDDTSAATDTGAGSETAADTDPEAQENPLIVTVGEAEITASDVQSALMAFPPQVRQMQSPETLIPAAIEQLILRELVLKAAMDEDLDKNEEVLRLLEEDSARTSEDAMVQVYIEREMEGAVTDEAVQDAYDAVVSDSQAEVPPLDEVRPQVEQQVRQERLKEIGDGLAEGVEIVFYGPDGQPRDRSGGSGSGAASPSGEDEGQASERDTMPETGDEIEDGASSN